LASNQAVAPDQRRNDCENRPAHAGAWPMIVGDTNLLVQKPDPAREIRLEEKWASNR
jgi:hypothetical protein